jgi:Rieske Fe-S protein
VPEQRPPCGGCLSRRDFVARGAGAGAALVLAGCGDGIIGPTATGGPQGQAVVRVADYPALAAAGVLVDVGGGRALKRTGAASFVAFSMTCTHAGCATVIAANRFDCPCHGSRFDAEGRVLVGPATRPLPTLPASYDAARGEVTIG